MEVSFLSFFEEAFYILIKDISKKYMSIEGFEPSPCYGIAPEATALDRSAKLTNLKISYIIILSI